MDSTAGDSAATVHECLFSPKIFLAHHRAANQDLQQNRPRAALLGASAAMSGEAAGAARCPSCGEADVRHEFDLGCEICAACGHVLSERALTASVQFDEDGAQGVFLHDGGTRGQHLAAARSGLAMAPGSAPGVARAMFRDEQSTHLANINRAVDFAAQQLRLTKDAAADARALVVRASEGRWGEGDWTTLLVGACVYCAARQNTLPIAMRDVAEACQLDVFALGRVYNKLKRLFALVVPPTRVDAFVARAAAAVPELTKESILCEKRGAARDARRETRSTRSTLSNETRSRENERPATETPTPTSRPAPHAASRAKDLAPLVEDAKALLSFAETRGLLVGRNPVPFVAASLGVAAEARGVSLSHEKTAAAARASVFAATRASRSLRAELVAFANTFEWGREVRLKSLPAFLPSLVPHVAGALDARNAVSNAVRTAELANDRVSADLARAAAGRVEAMPASFRAHEKTRLAREARLRRAKAETLAALDAAGDAMFHHETTSATETAVSSMRRRSRVTNAELREELLREEELTASTRARLERPRGENRAEKTGVRVGAALHQTLPSTDLACVLEPHEPQEPRETAGLVAIKCPSRGGVRRARRVHAEAPTRTSAAAAEPLALPALGASPSYESRAMSAMSADFDWSDVALRRLLLEGVPETTLAQEKALHAAFDADATVRSSPNAVRSPSAVRSRPRGSANAETFSETKRTSATLLRRRKSVDHVSASEAVRRVRRRTRDARDGRDVLSGPPPALPGGVTWKTPSATFVERCDKEAMDAIPDAEIACLLRTAEETAFARALAERERAEREGTSNPSDSRSGGPGVPAEARGGDELPPRGGETSPDADARDAAPKTRGREKKRFVKAERGVEDEDT